MNRAENFTQTMNRLFLYKKPNEDKLLQYGFVRQGEEYLYSKPLKENNFYLVLLLSRISIVKLQVMDQTLEEEYTLIHNPGAAGSFVGGIRQECETLIRDIIYHCYEPDIFKSEYAKQIIAYLRENYGAEAEYLWERFPNNAIFREPKTQKWFAALLTVEKRKIGIDEDGSVEIIDLKEKPEVITALVDGVRYLPGYHMNKKHWYTICLDGSVEIEEICARINRSFAVLNIKRPL